MRKERLDLSHQSLLRERFQRLNLFLSEYSFANLYLFRDLHNYQILQNEKDIFIQGKTRDNKTFIMLTTSPAQIAEKTLYSVLPYAEMLFPIPDQWLPLFEGKIREGSFKEEDSDYLFQMTKFVNYSGLGVKRNLVNQILKAHQIKEENLNSQFAKEAQQVLDHWQEDQKSSIEQTDYKECLKAIHHLEELNLHGRLIYVDDRPLGLIIGEWITPRCYTIHFCKGGREVTGLYQYMHQDLVRSFKEKEGWLNLEQDLGILNLRKAKQSYHPDLLLPKWRLKLK